MKKTFKQLIIGDPLWVVYEGKAKIHNTRITGLTMGLKEGIIYVKDKHDFRTTGTCISLNDAEELNQSSKRSRLVVIFTSEVDARRYAKEQIMKELNSKIEKAKAAIKDVKDFRNEYFQELNNDLTERVILELERTI